MGDRVNFPSKIELENAVLKSLIILGGTASNENINNKVIEIMDLSEEIIKMEDESGIGTKLNYRLRWVRTELKEKNKIKNISRGIWSIID